MHPPLGDSLTPGRVVGLDKPYHRPRFVGPDGRKSIVFRPTECAPLNDANVVTSLVRVPGEPKAPSPEKTPWLSTLAGRARTHYFAVDIDHPVEVYPSTTPGHFHLYIKKPMTWDEYQEALMGLVRAGIVEPGYMLASQERGFTALRLPWVRKTRIQEEL